MTTTPPVPLFLQSGMAESLNRQLIEHSGCFAFIKTDLVSPFKTPASSHDAFAAYVVGLYALYHDYGCQFLRLLLTEKMSPPGMDRAPLPELIQHIDDIELILRPNVTHGIFPITERIRMQTRISSHYLLCADTGASVEQWPEFITTLSDTHWTSATQCLVRDSDHLYRYLEQWAEAWKTEPLESQHDLKKTFAQEDKFGRSFDLRICSTIAEQCRPSVKLKRYYNHPRNGRDYWHHELRQCFLNGSAVTPEALYRLLYSLVDRAVNPPTVSSVIIAKKYGLGI